ncbi:cupin domain-containing protein [Fusibacter ferrireducens]|uniref:Cupin domain-containing protein n=1 Tax=Fusibacter ferrireducens TaxID=2785058 RepID=A0ABR9ZY69_9FIRM|nr:cupin domain-containing protein [Fusibacter ferrireducens]MBF4695412.1 cupin domain-containing protein [Fusibacter ferrireducens]
MHIDVGKKIKELRKSMALTIANLAEKSEISASMISQIENGKVVPTVIVMWKIANALNVSVGYFFDEGEGTLRNPVVKKDERKKMIIGKSSRTYEMLTPDQQGKIEFLMITIRADEEKARDFVTHEGEECGYVLKGKMKITVGDQTFLMGEGDSITFQSTIPHKYDNVGEEDCVSIWAMTPPSF